MRHDEKSRQKTGPEMVASALVVVARFSVPIQMFVFLGLAHLLTKWLAAPIAYAIAAFLVVLPSSWFIPKGRKIVYVAGLAITAACLSFILHLLIP